MVRLHLRKKRDSPGSPKQSNLMSMQNNTYKQIKVALTFSWKNSNVTRRARVMSSVMCLGLGISRHLSQSALALGSGVVTLGPPNR